MKRNLSKYFAVIFTALFGAVIFYVGTLFTPRDDLLERYAKVTRLERKFFNFDCTATKGRTKYEFTAIRHDGTEVKGYACYTPLSFYPTTVHEQ